MFIFVIECTVKNHTLKSKIERALEIMLRKLNILKSTVRVPVPVKKTNFLS